MTCKTYSRAFLHNLVAKGLPFASHLVTYHNVAYTQVQPAYPAAQLTKSVPFTALQDEDTENVGTDQTCMHAGLD